MKKLTSIIGALTLALALCGMALSFTIGSRPTQRARVSQVFIFASLAGFAASAALRGAAGRAETVGAAKGAVSALAKRACTFENVAANDEALASLSELRDYLRDPEKYVRYGARMPRGVLLYGPPGTGKTLLARALAGEAGVPFFALSGSDFVEKYVGVGASRVRDLFKRARKAGKCVIFIDEIDAMGKRRDDASSDERDQTLNALLSEMSGFNTGDGVVVIAATNRAETLDPALLRPGRFDRQIPVDLPGRDQRLSILRLHAENKPMDDSVSLDALAAQTVGFSGAALENLLNEAALLAAGRGAGGIGKGDVQAAFFKTVAGADRPSAASAEERRAIAVHEAGHAVASRLLAPENRLVRVSILPAGRGAAGYNLCVPEERVMVGKRRLENQICVLLAGRAAERLAFGDEGVTAGASSDLARAAELAGTMVCELGMAGEPAVSLAAVNRACGGGSNASDACKALLNRLFQRTEALLSAQAKAVSALSEALLERETLAGDDATAIIDGSLSRESQESA